MEEWGEQCWEQCRNPRRQFRDNQAKPREADAIFGFRRFENPHPPISVIFGQRGRAGEPGGTWGGAQGPGGKAGAGVRTRIRLILAHAGFRSCTKNSGIFGKSAEDFPGYRLRGSIPNWEQIQAEQSSFLIKFRYIVTHCKMYRRFTVITVK